MPSSLSLPQHTAQNVKEEGAQILNTLESAVSGSDGSGAKKTEPKTGDDAGPATHASSLLGDASTITGEMAKRVPQPALLWGAAGIVPYVGTAGASIYLSRQANLVASGQESSIDLETAQALLLHAQNIQVAYGAIILSFLGAIHWGFEWAKLGGRVGNLRYAMGVAPLAFAWPTLLLGPQLALVSQFGAYVGIWFIDLRATTEGWAPSWYSTYRFWLTAAVGTSIIATLAGTQYYDADPSRSSAKGAGSKLAAKVAADAKQKAQEIKDSAKGQKGTVPTKGEVQGEVFAEQSKDDDEGFVHIRNPKRVEEEKKKKEEEEKKKKEKGAKEKKEKEEKEKKEAAEKEKAAKEDDKDEGGDKEGDDEGESEGDDKKQGDEGEDKKDGEGEEGGDDKEGGDKEKKDK